MNVFVTGGSGYLGQSVLRRLVGAGHCVSMLARSDEAAQRVSRLGARPVRGDLGDVQAFEGALDGVDVVVHCAAPVEFWGPWERFESAIVHATMSLARAAAKRKVRRFVHVSSESVLQDRTPLVDIDETFPYPEKPNSVYGMAKMKAEKELLGSTLGLDVVVLRPTFIWGPGAPALRTISEQVKSRQFVWIDGAKADFEAVHVENVAAAIELALTGGADRNVYFVTDDERATVRSFFTRAFEALGIEPPTGSMPGSIASLLAALVEGVWKVLGKASEPPLSRFSLAFVQMPRHYHIGKARTELGYVPVVSRNEGFSGLRG